MKTISGAVAEGMARGVAKAFSAGGVVDQAIHRVLGLTKGPNEPLNQAQFTYAVARHLGKHGASAEYAISRAREIVPEMLKDEKIEFGHPDYAWTYNGAGEIAEEFELRFWEATA